MLMYGELAYHFSYIYISSWEYYNSTTAHFFSHPKMANHDQMPPNLPLTMRLKFSVGSFVMNRFIIRPDDTINRRLLKFLDAKVPPAAGGNNSVSSSDVSVDPSRDLWFRLFVPSTADKLPLIIHFHGGGFSYFTPSSKVCDDFCRALAAGIPAVVASVNYRLAPEHKFPCQYDDGFDVLKFINDRCHDVLPPNADLRRCFLAGDSAGGNISHHVAVRAGLDPAALGRVKLAGIVALQPFFGGEERTESELRLARAPVLTADGADVLWRMFLPAGADRDHEAVNVFGGDGVERVRSVGFPRTMVVIGGFDPLQDWQRRYAEGLEKCGKEVEVVEYENAFHSFYAFQELPEFEMLLRDVRGFLNKPL